jgi:hypothetical protein
MNNLTRPIWDDDSTSPETQIWRYMSVDRVNWLLTNARLYFAAATQFTDRFETAIQALNPVTDPRFPDVDQTEQAFRALRRLTKINCWHRADYESDAMWNSMQLRGRGLRFAHHRNGFGKRCSPSGSSQPMVLNQSGSGRSATANHQSPHSCQHGGAVLSQTSGLFLGA